VGTDEDLTAARRHFAGQIHGYRSPSAYGVAAAQLRRAVDLLAPAEAAVHWEHPDLWSWRELLRQAGPDARFVASFVADPDDPPADDRDAAFRVRLGG
jgi:hypothetical protein